MPDLLIQVAGRAALKPPHRFVIAGDSSLGEIFVKCTCDWQTIHYVQAGVRQDVTAMLEADIVEHNQSAGGILGREG